MKKLVLKYKNKIGGKKHIFLLVALCNFILTPVHLIFISSIPSLVIVINFSLVITAGLSICGQIANKRPYFVISFIGLLVIWLEFILPWLAWLEILRQICTLLLFVVLCYILIKELSKSKDFNLQSILGAISGFLFIGLIGGVTFEFLDTLIPNSFSSTEYANTYKYYYFSFISITTVGYGDIIPLTPPAQAITLIMNIIGQFYLTIVVALFVGKYLNKK
jgi:hypothetical protein